ncbi:MAG: lipoxygenase family protein [Planctomycetota bacterium]|nr:lipoxygenase family protein [Planctomycetota bacterium]
MFSVALILEPIWLCARRQLHDRHPVMELLKPHFKFTLAINHGARTNMLVPGGPLPTAMAAGYEGSMELLKRSFKDYGFHRFDLIDDLELRGVNKKDAAGNYKLPNYYYRDDGIMVANAIRGWVQEMLGLFYKTDQDVLNDVEVQAWIEELADPKRGNLSGLPDGGKLNSIDDLVDLLALTILKSSAEHSAANNGQYDYFGYVPNVPGLMRKPPPHNKKELTEQWLVEALPDFHQSAVQIAMVHLLSQPSPSDRLLGAYHDDFFAGHPGAILSTRRFHARLDRISAQIRTRDVSLDAPYSYLDPRRLSQSTEI